MTTPVKETLTVYQGATWTHRWLYQDENGVAIDLTGYTARMQVRDDPDSETVYVDATVANGKLVISAGAGSIDLIVPAAETAALSFETAQYDLELVHPDGTTVDKLSYGKVKLVREITKD